MLITVFAIIIASIIIYPMEERATTRVGKAELTPLERTVRNLLIQQMADFGIQKSSIARIMSLDISTVSRITKTSGV